MQQWHDEMHALRIPHGHLSTQHSADVIDHSIAVDCVASSSEGTPTKAQRFFNLSLCEFTCHDASICGAHAYNCHLLASGIDIKYIG